MSEREEYFFCVDYRKKYFIKSQIDPVKLVNILKMKRLQYKSYP